MSKVTIIRRNTKAKTVPHGQEIILKTGQEVFITQSLGTSFTLNVSGNLVYLNGKDADAINQTVNLNDDYLDVKEFNETLIWDQLKTCYDPEIPVNIVDLGLIYNLDYTKNDTGKYYINIKMTLTAPGCGMGPVIASDAENKVKGLSFVDDVLIELVWDPVWNQDMMTEEAKLKLGML